MVKSNSFPKDKILVQSKLKAVAGETMHVPEKLEIVLGRAENIAEKERTYWLPVFSPKGYLLWVVKGHDWVIKSKI